MERARTPDPEAPPRHLRRPAIASESPEPKPTPITNEGSGDGRGGLAELAYLCGAARFEHPHA